MIEVDSFTQCFLDQGLNYFTGVPDSTLKEWLRFLPNKEPMLINRIAANEGSAISNAAGYHLATGNIGGVYLQNSGLGNCINPLTSLMDSDVYGIPVVMLIGWRGEPGTKDEPQHKKMGNITEEMLAVLDIPYEILDNDYEKKRLVESFSRFIHVSHHSMEKSLIHYPLINKEMLTNIISSLIPISNKEQQKLLELPDLGLRLEIVCQYLENDGDKKEKDDILSIFDPIPINWN